MRREKKYCGNLVSLSVGNSKSGFRYSLLAAGDTWLAVSVS